MQTAGNKAGAIIFQLLKSSKKITTTKSEIKLNVSWFAIKDLSCRKISGRYGSACMSSHFARIVIAQSPTAVETTTHLYEGQVTSAPAAICLNLFQVLALSWLVSVCCQSACVVFVARPQRFSCHPPVSPGINSQRSASRYQRAPSVN